jgi:hypothetical protein
MVNFDPDSARTSAEVLKAPGRSTQKSALQGCTR